MATVSGMHKDELRSLINVLLNMLSDQAESIHLHEADFRKVKASPASFGLSLSDSKDIVAYRDGRTITVKSVKQSERKSEDSK